MTQSARPMPLRDRAEAGRRLAARLEPYAGRSDLLVLGLPRGGVPVAFEVARALGAPLDVCVVRKLGLPGHEEVAMGALAVGGTRVIDWPLVERLSIPASAVDRITALESRELERREKAYRGDRPPLSAQGRTVILVDDGLATGWTMQAAVQALRLQHPERIVVAAGVGTSEACARLQELADDCVCVLEPRDFGAVGRWYADFAPTTDAEVVDLLERAR